MAKHIEGNPAAKMPWRHGIRPGSPDAPAALGCPLGAGTGGAVVWYKKS